MTLQYIIIPQTVLALEGFLLVPQTVLALEGFLLRLYSIPFADQGCWSPR